MIRAWLAIATAVALVALLAGALPGPAAAAPNVYVTNQLSANVSQFETSAPGLLGSLTPSTVATGSEPRGIAVSPVGESAYVASIGTDVVSQYDIAGNGNLTAKSPPTVGAGTDPRAIVVNPDGSSVYVANVETDNISQYDVGTGGRLTPKSVPTVAAGDQPFAIAASPDGDSVYVANVGPDTISQYDVGAGGALTPKTPPTVATGTDPQGITVSPDGDSAYAANGNSAANTVSQYTVAVNGTLSPKTPPTVPAGSVPIATAVTPDGDNAYVVNQNGGNVSQYSVAANGTLSALTPPTVASAGSRGIATSPDGRSVYVTDSNGRVRQFTVSANGALSPKSPASVGAGEFPAIGIAVRPDTIPPTTTIDSGPSGTVGAADASFAFSANEPDSTFRCSVDGGAFSACSSPDLNADLSDGAHSFAVRATDFSGNTGPAATRAWTIELPSLSLGKVKKNKQRGTAKLTAKVSGAGSLELSGKGLKKSSKEAQTAGTQGQAAGKIKLPVKAKGKAAKRLDNAGKAKVKPKVTFTASLEGSEPVTDRKKLKLVKK